MERKVSYSQTDEEKEAYTTMQDVMCTLSVPCDITHKQEAAHE